MLASPMAIQADVSLPAWPAFAGPLRSAKSRWSILREIAAGESSHGARVCWPASSGHPGNCAGCLKRFVSTTD